MRYGFFTDRAPRLRTPVIWAKGFVGTRCRSSAPAKAWRVVVHIEEATLATVTALECAPGPYNIFDDNPSQQRVWLRAFARACEAPEPIQITEQEALATYGSDSVYYATRLRGASNEKADTNSNSAHVRSSGSNHEQSRSNADERN